MTGLSGAGAATIDTTAPVKTAIETDAGGTMIIVSYDEALAATAPLVGDYAVEVNGVANVATAVVIAGSTVEISLTTPIVNGDVVTLAYTQSAGAEVQDAAGNFAVDFTAEAVTNNVPAADTTAPSVTYSPIHNATDVAITVVPTITFNEAIRRTVDGLAPTNVNVGALITFNKTDAAGAAVAFTATINDAKTVITITPTSSLDNNQIYYLGIGPDVEDAAGNAVTSSHARFTTISSAPVPAPVVVSSSGISAAEAAAIRAANEAAEKAEAEKVAKAKAEADAKAAAEAAAKALADKAALEKAAAEKAAADKVEAERNAAAQAIVKAEEARVAAAEAKAAATDVKLSTSRTGLRLTLDLPDKYVGRIVTIYVGTTVKGKTTYKKLDFFALDKEDGTATISSKVKLTKGQVIRVNVGRTVLQTLRVR
jgi:uncharacterized repeat protein (TIGR02059 family)